MYIAFTMIIVYYIKLNGLLFIHRAVIAPVKPTLMIIFNLNTHKFTNCFYETLPPISYKERRYNVDYILKFCGTDLLYFISLTMFFICTYLVLWSFRWNILYINALPLWYRLRSSRFKSTPVIALVRVIVFFYSLNKYMFSGWIRKMEAKKSKCL